jgi:hypothetical protein
MKPANAPPLYRYHQNNQSSVAMRDRLIGAAIALVLASGFCLADERARIDPKTGLIEQPPSCGAIAAAARTHVSDSAPTMRMVVGYGRLQFFSAPDERCAAPGVFVVPGDSLAANAQLNAFAFAEYTNPRTHVRVAGWVHSDRLATVVDEKD